MIRIEIPCRIDRTVLARLHFLVLGGLLAFSIRPATGAMQPLHVEPGAAVNNGSVRGSAKWSAHNKRHLVCHRAGGSFHELSVPTTALRAHLAHGDCLIDDGVDCTVDRCEPILGCVHEPDDSGCDDQNTCTMEACDPHQGCVVEPVDCGDGNACTVDSCDPATGCFHAPVSCPDDGNPCTADVCQPETGLCVHPAVPDGTPCDDGDACTEDEFCFAGECGNGVDPCPQGPNLCLPVYCDPNAEQCVAHPVVCPELTSECFEIVCITTQGACETRALPRPPRDPTCDGVSACATNADCADNDACTNESCIQDGVLFRCIYPFQTCNDGNPCTIDSCHPAHGCVHTLHNPTSLCGDDGVACTVERCDPAQGCVSEADDSQCNDGRECTIDRCDPTLGCVALRDESLCGDGVCSLECLETAGNCPEDCVGENSCQGEDACLNASGRIGDNSCNGALACAGAGGTIGDSACNGIYACRNIAGDVGDGSCNTVASGACAFRAGDVGTGSCNGQSACAGVGGQANGKVGDISCNADFACCNSASNLASNTCNSSCECAGDDCLHACP